MRHPLFSVSILFALGICIGNLLHIPFFVLYILALFIISLGFVLLKKQRQSTVCILFFYFLLGSIFYKNANALPNNHLSKINFVKNESVFLKGVVVSEPKVKVVNRINKTNFILGAEGVMLFNQWHKVCGKVLVNSYAPFNFSYGDYLILEGKLFSPKNFFLREGFSYRDYLLRQGIHFVFSVKKQNLIERIDKNRANFLKAFSLRAKGIMQRIIYDNLPSQEAGVLQAIILGERGNLSKEINNLFIQTGTAHILAISGLHVAIVIFIILTFLKALRINRKWRFSLTIIFIVIYAILTGSRPSVIRASIMAIVFLIGILLERESDIYNSLGFSALIILLINPQTLFDVGFQLSFISVLSIVWLLGKIEKPILKLLNIKSGVLLWLVRLFCVSFSAWLGVLGLIAYYFNIFSPITLLANLFIVPFISILVAAGFCLIAMGTILPQIAFIFAHTTKFCIDVLIGAAYYFSKIPFAYFYLKSISVYLVLGYYLVILIVFGRMRVQIRD